MTALKLRTAAPDGLHMRRPLEVAAPEALDSRVRARGLGWLYVAGGSIGALSLALPHSPDANELALWSNIALAFAAGVGLLTLGARLPLWAFHVAGAAGTVLIARAVLYSGEEVSFYSVWFIWVGLYAFYFFGRIAAACHVAFVAAAYAVTLVYEPGTSPLPRWLTTVATLVVAGVFIDTLVRRARGQAVEAAQSAGTMATVARIAHELSRHTDSSAARAALCSASADVSGADSVVLWEPSADGTGLSAAAVSGRRPGQSSLPFVGPISGASRAFASGVVVVAPKSEPAREMAPELLGRAQPSACVWQPVLRDGVTVAVMGFYWSAHTDLEGGAVLTVIDLLAAEAAVTLQRVELLGRLESVARTDDLTGLPNRRAWEEELPREMARARRDSRELCVVMIDLDKFKLFNDRHGHQAGDRLLKQAASAWAQELRTTDVLARYGGEEFALALPGGRPEEDALLVERLRAVTPDGQTCSAGMARWDGEETSAELVGRADAALYEAKRAGRDRVVAIA